MVTIEYITYLLPVSRISFSRHYLSFRPLVFLITSAWASSAMSPHAAQTTVTPDSVPTVRRQFVSAFDNKDASGLEEMADKFVELLRLPSTQSLFRRAVILAHDEMEDYNPSRDERKWLDSEKSTKYTEKFRMPWKLFLLVFLCSMGAAVQGWVMP